MLDAGVCAFATVNLVMHSFEGARFFLSLCKRILRKKSICRVTFHSFYAGIHAEIAEPRHEYWSRFASRPVEVILAAGRKAKDVHHSGRHHFRCLVKIFSFQLIFFSVNLSAADGLDERERVLLHKEDLTKKVDLESMLMVEKGLRELSALKVHFPIMIPHVFV